MDIKETKGVFIKSDTLLHNEDYFKYIFKKTEKICAAVFYTTRSLNDDIQKDMLVHAVEQKTIAVLDILKRTLETRHGELARLFETFRVELLGLESALIILSAARIIREDLLEVFRHELNTLHRSLRDYTRSNEHHPFEFSYELSVRQAPVRRERTVRTSEPAREAGSGEREVVVVPGRRERILDIIRQKGQVTIKDVSTAITDVSEKTIQRELISLIEDSLIQKEGERRWSKYSLRQV